jgi:hypothetical protein
VECNRLELPIHTSVDECVGELVGELAFHCQCVHQVLNDCFACFVGIEDCMVVSTSKSTDLQLPIDFVNTTNIGIFCTSSAKNVG